MADLTPMPMGIQWDPWDPSLPHSHAHLYLKPKAWFLGQPGTSLKRQLDLFIRFSTGHGCIQPSESHRPRNVGNNTLYLCTLCMRCRLLINLLRASALNPVFE